MSLKVAKDAASEENVTKKDETTEDVEMSPADAKESVDPGKTATKRPHKKDGPQAKRRKGENATPKNALMQLNQLKPGLKYVVDSQEGPPHNPIFIAHVVVNDEKFIGKGRSKQLAKHAAAEAALKSFVQFRNMPEVLHSLSTKRPYPVSVDFTDDSVITENVFDEPSKAVGGNESTYWQHKVNNKLRKYVTESEKKNPVLLLNEIWPGLTYKCVAENPLSIYQRFVMTLDLDGEQFEGAGPSKKAAKAAVARTVLSQKYGVKFHSYTAVIDDSDKALFDFPQELADEMGKLVHDAVDKIAPVSKGFPQWKVLAGVVMTKDEAMTDMQVICFGTGTKSLKGTNMSLNGAVLNDCHAEVIARRCLKDFFFSQLELHVSGHANQSIFEKVSSSKFKLKSNHRFHFYVTSAPCGDAGVFPVQEEDIIAELNADHSGYKSGVLRTKLESGDGTLPVETVLQSEQKAADTPGQMTKYHIMSCSDKITTWNVLGVQGSLLNYFIEPIYFHTIIIGQLFHRNHMLNAVFKRIEPALGNLPPPFVLYKPKLTNTSTAAARYIISAPQVSINWTCGLNDPEFVVAKNGKTRDGEVSRLAKRQFFQRFNKMHDLLLKAPSTSKFYGAVKKASPNYAQAKEAIVKAFFTCGHGFWKRKPAEQEWFDLNF